MPRRQSRPNPRSVALTLPRLKLHLLVNSFASSVTARARVVIQKALSADHDVTVAETSRRGHASTLARSAARAGADVVAVLGGDGTLNETANGLAGTDTALAALPGGSTNVFARTIGMPNDPIEATGVLLDALALETIRPVGLGTVGGRYFLFHVGIGFDAAVVRQVERRSDIKRYAGHPLFIYAAITTWLRHYDRSRPHFAVSYDDGSTVDDGYLAICCNTSPYTYLGNRQLTVAPDADLDHGLALVTVRTLGLTTILGLAASALRSGRWIRSSRQVDYRSDLSGFTIGGHGPVPYQVDGDYLGDSESLVFRHRPEVLRLVTPPADSGRAPDAQDPGGS